MAARLEQWWRPRRERCLWLLAGLMLGLAIPWLGYQFWRLTIGDQPIWATSPRGAVDLAIFSELVSSWFAGEAIYETTRLATYPPASYPLLWLVVGWLPFAALRWVWCGLFGLVLWRLSTWCADEAGESRAGKLVLSVLPLAIYPSGATIGNGQLGLFVLAALMAMTRYLGREVSSWRAAALVIVLLVAALVKPTLTAPFFWLVLFAPGGRPAALLAAVAYLGLTLFSAAWQSGNMISLLGDWLALAKEAGADYYPTDMHGLAGALGWQSCLEILSLGALLLLGVFLRRHRHAPLYLLAAICAIVARFWAHHAWYDDLIMLLPSVALWRLASTAATPRQRTISGALFAPTLVSLLAPGGLYLLPGKWRDCYLVAQIIIWLTDLVLIVLALRWRVEGSDDGIKAQGVATKQ